jgi:hypothetical protein
MDPIAGSAHADGRSGVALADRNGSPPLVELLAGRPDAEQATLGLENVDMAGVRPYVGPRG